MSFVLVCNEFSFLTWGVIGPDSRSCIIEMMLNIFSPVFNITTCCVFAFCLQFVVFWEWQGM